VNTSLFFQSDFYRQADELSAQLARVEAAWADRFEPPASIFNPSQSLEWMMFGQAIVDGVLSGIQATEGGIEYLFHVYDKWHARPWFNHLPRQAQAIILTSQRVADGRQSAGSALRQMASMMLWELRRWWFLRGIVEDDDGDTDDADDWYEDWDGEDTDDDE
jgi:hypothetical protein